MHSQLKKLLTLALLIIASNSLTQAQNFTESISNAVEGEGTVNIYQDPRLENIINGVDPVEQLKKEKNENRDDFSMTMGKRKRMRGYRIQVFWGGSTRNDQQKAQRLANQVRSIYPELDAYATFESPHWRCRVGDFISRDEAAEYLSRMRKISSEAMIVPSEILIFTKDGK